MWDRFGVGQGTNDVRRYPQAYGLPGNTKQTLTLVYIITFTDSSNVERSGSSSPVICLKGPNGHEAARQLRALHPAELKRPRHSLLAVLLSHLLYE